jgi:cytochrome c-type biogenesis protein CcmH
MAGARMAGRTGRSRRARRAGTYRRYAHTIPRAIAVLAACFAVVGLPAASFAAEPQASLPDIEDEVMCIVCGVPLELAEESPQANQERDLIRRLIAQGLTKQQIEDRLVAQYGPNVLATPGNSGFDLAAWLVPGIAIVVAGVAIFIGLRRWRRAGTDAEPSGSDAPAAAPAPDDEDSKRLDADLARYEL